MLTHLPALSHFFGLKPEDLDRMTFREIDRYVAEAHVMAQARTSRGR